MIGHVEFISRNRIAGWAADPASPDGGAFVRVVVNGRAVRVTADIMRNDLLTIFSGATGRYGFELDSGLFPLSPFVDNVVEVVFVKNGNIVPDGKMTFPALGEALQPEAQTRGRSERLAPIVLLSSGRSGTSLFMARLARHPEIVVAREHPFELKLLSYYTLALRTLVAEADRDHSTDPDTMVAMANRFFIGFNPYHDARDAADGLLAPFWEKTAPTMLRDCFAGLIQEHYALVAHETNKMRPRFFAEKIGTVNLVREATAFMFGGVHEIILVRDPRDIICSAGSFWHRDFALAVRMLRADLVGMGRPRIERGARQHVVRYEDLLLRPQHTMAAVFGFLSLPALSLEPDSVAESRTFGVHGTTGSPGESVARWRRELTAEQLVIANKELQPFLEKYGYPVD